MKTSDAPPVLTLLVLAAPILVVGCYAGSHVHTSDGYRDSTVRKVSESGIAFKTWEVETLGDGIRMTGSSDAIKAGPETFAYTASREIAESLRDLPAGKRVRVHYSSYLTPWYPKGYSKYFITRVETLPEVK